LRFQPLEVFRINIPGEIVLSGPDIVLEMMKRAIDQMVPHGSAIERVVLMGAPAKRGINPSLEIRENHGPVAHVQEFSPAGRNLFHPGHLLKGH
jgi:hypothetical protein